MNRHEPAFFSHGEMAISRAQPAICEGRTLKAQVPCRVSLQLWDQRFTALADVRERGSFKDSKSIQKWPKTIVFAWFSPSNTV